MLVTNDFLKQLIKMSTTTVDADALIDDEPLLKQGIDSLDMLDLYFNIEDKLNMSIPDDSIDELKTLEDFKLYLNNAMK